jgi:hypothetical protein
MNLHDGNRSRVVEFNHCQAFKQDKLRHLENAQHSCSTASAASAGLCPIRHSTGLRPRFTRCSRVLNTNELCSSRAVAAAPHSLIKCTNVVCAKACKRHGPKSGSSTSSRSSRWGGACAFSSSVAASYVVSAAVDTQQGESGPANSEGQSQQQQQQQQQHSQREQELRQPEQSHLTHLVVSSVGYMCMKGCQGLSSSVAVVLAHSPTHRGGPVQCCLI